MNDTDFEAMIRADAVPLMRTRGLCFDARGRRLIDNVGVAIRPGRRTMVMGANGAGKSLLLRLLHGLIEPTAGEIRWRGKPMNASARQRQAMVFQRPVMLRRSVVANLQFALSVRGLRGRQKQERAWHALEQAGLADLASRPARVLSGGEQQRLAVARALACEPEILFLDEPTASLDPASTQAVEAMLERAAADHVTIVMITHDAGQARRLGDDMIFMANGRVVETGSIIDVLDAPRSEAARAWLEGRLYLDPSTRS